MLAANVAAEPQTRLRSTFVPNLTWGGGDGGAVTAANKAAKLERLRDSWRLHHLSVVATQTGYCHRKSDHLHLWSWRPEPKHQARTWCSLTRTNLDLKSQLTDTVLTRLCWETYLTNSCRSLWGSSCWFDSVGLFFLLQLRTNATQTSLKPEDFTINRCRLFITSSVSQKIRSVRQETGVRRLNVHFNTMH